MLIEKDKKIESCVSKDKFRLVLNHVYLDTENSRVIATDGRAMSIVKVQVQEGDVSGFITPESLKESRKSKDYMTELSCNGSIHCKATGKTYVRPSLDAIGNYPQVNQVIPKEDRKEIEISFDPELLLNIAKALGNENQVVMRIEVDEKGEPTWNAYKIIGKGDDVGVLMPKRNK